MTASFDTFMAFQNLQRVPRVNSLANHYSECRTNFLISVSAVRAISITRLFSVYTRQITRITVPATRLF